MDELSPGAREALRRYHDAAGLGPAGHARVWRELEASLADEPPRVARRAADRRRNLAAASLVTAVAAAVLFAVCDVRRRLSDDRRGDSDAAVYEATPASERATAEPRAAATSDVSPPSEPPVVTPPKLQKPAARRPRERDDAAALGETTAEPPGLAAEVALMRQARADLDGGRPDAALQALAEHAQRFSAGQMQEDREMLRIEALCALGRGDEARAGADAFLRAHPNSTHTRRVRSLCRD